MSQMLHTSEFDEDSQAKFTVLFGWTAQNHFKLHVCNTDCIIWIRQSSRELRDCGKRSRFRQNFTGLTLCLLCWVTVGTWADVAVNQTLKKEGKVVGGNKIFINHWKHNLKKWGWVKISSSSSRTYTHMILPTWWPGIHLLTWGKFWQWTSHRNRETITSDKCDSTKASFMSSQWHLVLDWRKASMPTSSSSCMICHAVLSIKKQVRWVRRVNGLHIKTYCWNLQ